MTKRKFGIAVHGGAGHLPFYGMTKKREKEFGGAIAMAVQEGYALLHKGWTAIDAVEQSIKILEDNPLFNAGRGAVFTATGKNFLDASLMCGKTLKAGAVCRVRKVKNPIALARAIMEHSDNLFLAGKGAENFAKQMHLALVSPDYFFTQERYDQWKEQKKYNNQEEHGTVGAVALDRDGNLAAGTSTGGLTNKNDYRIGDSPIIGSGTYANNKTCAVSCTGRGESIIRAVAAHEISCLLEYKKITLKQASRKIMQEKLTPFGGHAGFIAIDSAGNIRYVFNTERMYRGWKRNGDRMQIKIY
jgi:beta-aspartyl-peptidase (threonine type)